MSNFGKCLAALVLGLMLSLSLLLTSSFASTTTHRIATQTASAATHSVARWGGWGGWGGWSGWGGCGGCGCGGGWGWDDGW